MALGDRTYADAAAWACTGRVVEPDPAWAEAADARYRRFRELSRG